MTGTTVATGTAPAASSDQLPAAGGVPGDHDLAVRTDGLTKRFRSGQVAVDGLGLHVPRGSVYGFLGPNGSGKTTTIRMLLGLVRPTSGRAWLLDGAMPEAGATVLPRVGALVEGPAFHPYLTGRANLVRLDASDATADPRTSRRRTEDALERVGLSAAAAKPYRQYSLGMKQRLGLAAALLRPRELLVLDEPTNGLDPQGTREVRHLVRELADAGTTVLVSSHLLAEIEQVCTHIGIMSRGRLLLQGERQALTDRGTAHVGVTTSLAHVGAVAEVLTGLGLTEVTTDGPTLRALLASTPPEKISAAIVHAGLDLVGLEVTRPSLEQVFVALTGEGFDVAR
ncbi:multidrug ABC transporter ATP-binding protein [Cellulomonas cellasea DSM 20118]|uniref:Multidrug ABC transporter ATP-binding protein n=1 Tax=Cellulomonas cellasea DSM 20118 TaxID=1408250 RepID=A0A0A0B7N8_9CELL|nr:multidrug ABC transporter ATP-binding protein [Cellulomonas cellasea DSM 20118]